MGALCKYRSEKCCLAIDVICGITSRLKSAAVKGRAPGGEKRNKSKIIILKKISQASTNEKPRE